MAEFDRDSTAGADAGLEAKLRQLYAVYGYLRDADLAAHSQTARLLHPPDPALFRRRLADELEELAGVAAGTHGHHGLPADAILEASQVGYWTFLAAVAAGLPYDALRPHVSLEEAGAVFPGQAAALGLVLAGGLRGESGPLTPADLRAALRQAGLTCRALGVEPAAAVDYDLAQMRARPYLAGFFATKGSPNP